MAGRTNRAWEEEMLAEYLAANHTDARTIQRVRLGPHQTVLPDATLTPEEKRLIGAAWRRWADAVIITPVSLTIVEAAMVPDPGDVSRLLTYLELAPHTPELEPYLGRELKGLLVWGVDDPFSRLVAQRNHLSVVIFRPSNFTQWASVKRARETGAPRAAQILLT